MHIVKVEIPQAEPWHYPIFVGNNLLENTGSLIKDYLKARKLLVVSNETVFNLYADKVKASLEKQGFNAEFLLLEDGEQYKNVDSLQKIWTKAIELKLERKDAIIALGGGVIGDVTGFGAATYLRGIGFVQIPTTLLAQVDSSVGGKAAINHQLGKNLIGNFYQPKAVIADISTLSTLSERELKVGLAEVLKYAFIEKSCGLNGLENSFMEFLKSNKDSIMALEPQVAERMVKYCCELKASVVNQDEKEAGLRAILNFGHTIGHAIEKCCSYQGINHGEAVATGMRGAFFLAKKKRLISQEYYNTCIELLDKYEMSYKINKNMSSNELYKAMRVDKKVQAGKIRFILPVNFSEVGIFSAITEQEVLSSLETLYSK